MYQIKSTSSGVEIGMTDTPTYIIMAANGCFNLCQKPEDASGIVFAGKPYAFLGHAMEGAEDTVVLETVDTGEALTALQKNTQAVAVKTEQINIATRIYVQANATTMDDSVALSIPDMFETWEDALASGTQLEANTILNDGGQLYRVVQAVTPQAHQAPHDDGMLAIYRPIVKGHDGTQTDPIPYVNGMDTAEGKYYSFNGKIYLCNLTMTPCVWDPGTPGLWQWTEVSA